MKRLTKNLIIVGPLLLAAMAPEVYAQSTAPVANSSRFSFYSDPWVGLHHLIFQWALLEPGAFEAADRAVAEFPERGDFAHFAAEEREIWTRVLDHYRQNLIDKPLTFDAGLGALKAALAGLDLPPERLEDELVTGTVSLLAEAMPIYLRRWWPAHDRENRRWIAELLPRLELHEEMLSTRIAEAYGGQWPVNRLRVDVGAYSNWAGAYTTNDPDHMSIGSLDPDIRGTAALELVFHESSHASSIEGPLRRAVSDGFRAAGVEEPGRFWHTLLFFTAGELTREAVASQGAAEHVPYGVQAGMYTRASWIPVIALLEQHWRPVLAGEADRATAVEAIARGLGNR